MSPRVLIFGTGSIGATYAFILSRSLSSSNIFTICRSNFEEASKNGFVIHSTIWGDNNKVQPVVARSVTEAVALDSTPFDYILVCSKALSSVPSIEEMISPAVSPTTTIVLLQNGIAIEEPFAKLFPNNPLLSTVLYLPVTQTSPGIIRHKEMELLHIGNYPASVKSDAATRFADLLKSAGGHAQVHKDIQFERWSKLLINAAWNPICALSRSCDAQVLKSHPDALDFVRDVMMEIASVANACGYSEINSKLVETQLGRARSRDLPGVQPSMMADALEGRNMEVDAIVGNVIKIGKFHGLKIPLLRTIYMLASALDGNLTRLRQG
jgi:2-dehydropantoate 2-reductase